MKNKISSVSAMKSVLEWWDCKPQLNVINSLVFYNKFSEYIFYRIEYYNTNTCELEDVIVKVNLETGEVTSRDI